jgi:hypothetical protein
MNATATMVSAGPQRMRALERANQARFARAELKRRVAQGDIKVAEVILTRPWEAERMAVADLLTSQRHWGHTRVRKFLASVAMSENKTIGSMTERQRQAVAARLSGIPRRTLNSSVWPAGVPVARGRAPVHPAASGTARGERPGAGLLRAGGWPRPAGAQPAERLAGEDPAR